MAHDPNSGGAGKQEKQYFFFVNDEKCETDDEVVTGAYIKSKVANLPPGTGLELEGHGNEPNKTIGENDQVSLALGHGEGPKRFTTVPPATFG